MIFTDKEFPPELSSLVNEGAKRPEKIPWEQIEWTRISNIPTLKNKRGQLTIFGDEVSPHDIKQSKLDDCYFVATLSALAAKPDRIKRFFKNFSLNDSGVWIIRMNKNGAIQEIIMDDFVPTVNGCIEDAKCVTRPVDRKLWPLILEKAWAKLHGSYERIIWG